MLAQSVFPFYPSTCIPSVFSIHTWRHVIVVTALRPCFQTMPMIPGPVMMVDQTQMMTTNQAAVVFHHQGLCWLSVLRHVVLPCRLLPDVTYQSFQASPTTCIVTLSPSRVYIGMNMWLLGTSIMIWLRGLCIIITTITTPIIMSICHAPMEVVWVVSHRQSQNHTLLTNPSLWEIYKLWKHHRASDVVVRSETVLRRLGLRMNWGSASPSICSVWCLTIWPDYTFVRNKSAKKKRIIILSGSSFWADHPLSHYDLFSAQYRFLLSGDAAIIRNHTH